MVRNERSHSLKLKIIMKVNIYMTLEMLLAETCTALLQAIGPENLDSEVQATTKEKLSSHFINTMQLDTREPKAREDLETQQSIID